MRWQRNIGPEQILDYIDHFLEDPRAANNWDEFLSIPLESPQLEAIRLRVTLLPEIFPAGKGEGFCGPEGMEELRQTANTLRASIHSDK